MRNVDIAQFKCLVSACQFCGPVLWMILVLALVFVIRPKYLFCSDVVVMQILVDVLLSFLSIVFNRVI